MIRRTLRDLALDPGEGLDDRHIAQGVGGPFGQFGVEHLDPRLKPLGAAHDGKGQNSEKSDQNHQHQAQTPVHQQGRRQKHEKRGDRGAILAKEGQPDAGHAAGAVEHDFQQPPRMGPAVETQRQLQQMVEKAGHDCKAAAVRQPVGVQGDSDGGSDGKQAEADPGAHQGRKLGPGQLARMGLSLGHAVDDAAEQHRLDELGAGERQIGENQQNGEAALRREQGEDASIDLEHAHEPPPPDQIV